MSTVNLQLDTKEIINLVGKLPLRDKIQLAQKLDQETWKVRFKNLIHGVDKRIGWKRRLSDDKIVRIVKRVRSERHARSSY